MFDADRMQTICMSPALGRVSGQISRSAVALRSNDNPRLMSSGASSFSAGSTPRIRWVPATAIRIDGVPFEIKIRPRAAKHFPPATGFAWQAIAGLTAHDKISTKHERITQGHRCSCFISLSPFLEMPAMIRITSRAKYRSGLPLVNRIIMGATRAVNSIARYLVKTARSPKRRTGSWIWHKCL